MKIVPMQVELIHYVGSDLTVVDAARVSFDKTSDWETNPDTGGSILSVKDIKLIHYLSSHKHHSPFNHSFLTFRVKAPIFVARQLVKHKFMPWNEVSRRYVDSEPEFYFPEGIRGKAENKKQGSTDEIVYKLDTKPRSVQIALEEYNWMIQAGCCAEQARMVLPQNTMTEWYWSGTLGAFLDMLKLRLDPHTQQETREVAELIAAYVKALFPISYVSYLEST